MENKTKDEWIDIILSELKNKSPTFITVGRNKEWRYAYDELKQMDLIEDIGTQTRFTKYGLLFYNSGKSYKTWKDEQSLPKIQIGQIGHTIYGDVNQSNLSISSLNRSITPPTIIHTKPNMIVSILKLIWKNIWHVIIGVLIIAIGYYFGFTKSS